MYRQIAEDLSQQIETGELAPGAQLRTELELREKYDASRNTIRDAIGWLISRGLVETRPGQGTFVVDKIIPFITTLTGEPRTASGGEGNTYLREVTAQFRRPKDSLPRVEIQPAEYSPELKLPAGTSVVSRHQQRYIDDTPWSLQTSFYPMSFVEDGAVAGHEAGWLA
jgi:GntR family transcriptional regulator